MSDTDSPTVQEANQMIRMALEQSGSPRLPRGEQVKLDLARVINVAQLDNVSTLDSAGQSIQETQFLVTMIDSAGKVTYAILLNDITSQINTYRHKLANLCSGCNTSQVHKI